MTKREKIRVAPAEWIRDLFETISDTAWNCEANCLKIYDAHRRGSHWESHWYKHKHWNPALPYDEDNNS